MGRNIFPKGFRNAVNTMEGWGQSLTGTLDALPGISVKKKKKKKRTPPGMKAGGSVKKGRRGDGAITQGGTRGRNR